MKYKLRTYYYVCNGPSCLECEAYIPGLQTSHGGDMDISEEFFAENEADILRAEAECPRNALTLDAYE